MSNDPQPCLPRKLFRLSLLAASLTCLTALTAPAQTTGTGNSAQNTASSASAAKPETAGEQPPFQDYKGVRIGMTAEEVRKKLGTPTDKGDTQDFYLVSDKESVQVMYDSAKKVSAIAVNYMNAADKAPTPSAIIGENIEARPDGSLYKLVRYPKAGYWVSYNRTGGNSPIVSVMMQKMN